MIKAFISRLFILTPITILLTLIGITLVIPFILWLFFGFNYLEWAIDIVPDISYFLEENDWL